MRRHAFVPGDRVKLLTRTGGCYDGKTGVVTEKLDGALRPYPEAAIPDFYRVKLDAPADIGDGTLSGTDVHPSNEVFPEDAPLKSFWD